MESPFAKLIIDIQKRIKDNIPEIKFIDENKGQYGFDDFKARVLFPAVLIDFPNTPFSDLSTNIQLGNCTISLSLMFDPYNNTSSLTPLNIVEAGLNYYEIEQKLHRFMQGWCLDYFTPLSRVNATSQNRNEIGIRIREVFYNTEFEDWSLDDDSFTQLNFTEN
ncbi:hypothetical protein [Flavobacterium sp.]|uniref:hypothetical protein n=1 Tax=Flavobacterium sp. TaxID=239 RepID=UPI00262A61A9|nr:hypothetical protein [Flavobacterium sp.]